MYNFIVTNKHGQTFNKNFIYVDHKEASGLDELDYYNLNDICDYEYFQKIWSDKCPQNILSVVNKFCKKYGELIYCIYGRHGILVFIKIKKKIPIKVFWKYNQWFFKKRNIIFDIREI